MPAKLGFAIEQALGHVAYGLGLRQALAARTDVSCTWLDIPFEPGDFGRIPLLGSNWTIRGSVRARRAISAARLRQPLDALFIHTQTIGLFGAKHMRAVPTLLSLDATPLNYDELNAAYGARSGPSPVEQAKTLAHRAVMRNVRHFTTWSDWAKASLVRDYGVPASAITVIAPGTVISRFPAPEARPERREGPLRALFVGGDFVRKGGDLLLDVWRRELRGEVELDLVTAAELPAEEGVRVHRGVKPYSPALLELYASADVFALPTRGDCLAVVLGEAMAAALPIITTRVGAHGEAVEDGVSGFLIDKDDGHALADRLRRLARDRELARRLGRQARRAGEARFDMTTNANRIADLMLQIARPLGSAARAP